MLKSDQIIIDTNLWISFLLTRQFDFLDDLLNNKKVKLIFSKELLEEFVEVSQRPKLKKFFSLDDLEILLQVIEKHAIFVSITSEVKQCRDEKDNFLLALAKDSGADYLLTGDKDLLAIEKFGRTEIVNIATYYSIYHAGK